MRNWWIRICASFSVMLLSLVLAACSGTSTSPSNTNNNDGQVTLAIQAPSTFAAGSPIATTITLTMYNTSNVNATNLVYTVPSNTNYTGVTITPYPDGLGNNCQNIAAEQSCQFTVVVDAFANPGSFTVDATPSTGSSLISKVKNLTAKALNSNTISVTANLSLVSIPANSYQFYVLPESQTINTAPSGSTTTYVSVLIESTAVQPFTALKLVDESGNVLTSTLMGTIGTESYAVNSYSVIIPVNVSLQHIRVNSYNGNSAVCNESCSNDATVTLAPVTAGILQVQPYTFSMNSGYTSQVITLRNTGNAGISGSLPVISAPFTISDNTCDSNYSLAPGANCTFNLTYTAGNSSGESSFVFDYNNGQQTTITVPYTGNVVVTTYAYLISGDESMQVCTLDPTNGGYTNCAMNDVNYSNQYSLTFKNMQNVTYAYIGTSAGESTPIHMCIFNSTDGSLNNCINNAISDTIPSWGASFAVSFNTSSGVLYAYVATGQTDGSGIFNGVYKCNVDTSSGMLSNCTIQTPASTDDAYQAAFTTVNGTDYMYVIQANNRDVVVCTLANNGDVSSCSNANYPIPPSSYPNPSWMEFQTVNSIQYVYIPDQTPSFYECQLSSVDGSFINCNNLITNESSSAAPEAQFGFATLNNNLYSYIMDYNLGATCNQMTQNGALVGGDITGTCGTFATGSSFSYGVALSSQ